jgi:hypothetical protein
MTRSRYKIFETEYPHLAYRSLVSMTGRKPLSLNDRARFCSFWISGWVPLVAALGHQCLHVAAKALIG